tara:strand:- start:2895 stop:3191 length:297 start_codon:yes stop_codon:yes gene_type:complete
MTTDDTAIEEARDFLRMMTNAYYEVWRRRSSGEPEISPLGVLAIFDDCEHHRRMVAHAAYDNERAVPATDLLRLDAVWRSLWHAVNGRQPKFVPPKMK